jgi:hypothetical protein
MLAKKSGNARSALPSWYQKQRLIIRQCDRQYLAGGRSHSRVGSWELGVGIESNQSEMTISHKVLAFTKTLWLFLYTAKVSRLKVTEIAVCN